MSSEWLFSASLLYEAWHNTQVFDSFGGKHMPIIIGHGLKNWEIWMRQINGRGSSWLRWMLDAQHTIVIASYQGSLAHSEFPGESTNNWIWICFDTLIWLSKGQNAQLPSFLLSDNQVTPSPCANKIYYLGL